MSKVLSVCVPSYNMEKYLNRCIDSLLVPEILDRLELIIVNDGSTDKTLSIANDYKARYPQTIIVIDKPNGHYGSCVNASLKIATGKYFRIVDADDWVDSNALVTFINKLETINVDCVCTKRTVHNFNENKLIEDISDIKFEGCMDLNRDIFPVQFLRMHNLTFSISLLQRINYTQTEGICYTDTEYTYTPLASARNMVMVDVSLYQYFVGRGDQSMSQDVLKKNIAHLVRVIQSIQRDHQGSFPFNANEQLICSTLLFRLLYLAVPVYLLHYKRDAEIDETLRKAIATVNVLDKVPLSGVFSNRIVGIPYVSCWYHNINLFNCISPILRLFKKVRRD